MASMDGKVHGSYYHHLLIKFWEVFSVSPFCVIWLAVMCRTRGLNLKFWSFAITYYYHRCRLYIYVCTHICIYIFRDLDQTIHLWYLTPNIRPATPFSPSYVHSSARIAHSNPFRIVPRILEMKTFSIDDNDNDNANNDDHVHI
jgi:hypothetical protein